jgi:hypothetical protein
VTAAFGEIAYEGGPSDASTTTTHGANGAAAQAEVIDINDPALQSESLHENPEGDSYAVPPPPPDGKWRVKLTSVPVKDKRTGKDERFLAVKYDKMNNGKPFLVTNVQSQILDANGKYDGIKLTDYHVKTALDRSGNSAIGTILNKLKQPLPPATPAARMEQFLKVLAGEPELVIETAWRASCQACQERAEKKGERKPGDFLQGMHRFPQVKGKPDPVVSCPECKTTCRAQLKIVSYWSLDTPHNP